MDAAIAYLEKEFPFYLETHEHNKVLHEYKAKLSDISYTHQFVLIHPNGFCNIVFLRVEKMYITLE